MNIFSLKINEYDVPKICALEIILPGIEWRMNEFGSLCPIINVV